MNGSKGLNLRKGLALMAMLFGSMVTTFQRPAYGQEFDPTWYNPWAGPNTVAAHSAQPQVAVHRHQPRVKHVSSTQRAGKVRGKSATAQTRPS